ncbi:MAG: hypothetical protein COT85_07045 [Chlamydiae bacterium CG10_big_fil_rev_8_21_14_0_10_42_34]|nr:MAG: hypothetical protein COT85_07045 [Chlamydiae bacterium CG10_big_fil_rev_8_21_14_0_10_42_34]
MNQPKKAVLCGASQGIGRTIAYKFHSLGWEVAILDVQSNEEMQSAGINMHTCDVSDFIKTESTFKKIFEDFGTVDVLVNCIRTRQKAPSTAPLFEQWEKALKVDLNTYLNASLIVCEKMKTLSKPCNIIQFSSITSHLITLRESMSYHTAKAAINQMTKYLAVQYGPYNIRVNAISPGLISNEKSENYSSMPDASLYSKLALHIPLRRSGSPEEVAEVALFLSTSASSFISGQEIVVDGGLSICEQVGIALQKE